MARPSVRRLDAGSPVAARVFGVRDCNLKAIEAATGARVAARGDDVVLEGKDAAVRLASALVADLRSLADEGVPLPPAEVEAAARLVAASPGLTLRQVLVEHALAPSDRKRIVPRTPRQARYLDAMRRHEMVLAIGPAGTGKTYLAVAMALVALRQRSARRIVLTRPAVEAGERLGFLPGDLIEKVNPYLRPLHDAIRDLADGAVVQQLLDRGDLEVAPLAFMRGRTLNESFIILDEAQNTTHEQMKMFVTRLGAGSRMVITGDDTQVDLPAGRASGLVTAARILAGIEGIAIVRFSDEDVVRHRLIRDIVAAYERDAMAPARRRQGEYEPAVAGPPEVAAAAAAAATARRDPDEDPGGAAQG